LLSAATLLTFVELTRDLFVGDVPRPELSGDFAGHGDVQLSPQLDGIFFGS